MPVSLFFSQPWNWFGQNFALYTTPTFSFNFAYSKWNMLGDSIDINNLCCNLLALKKFVKNSKNCFLGPINAQERSHYGPRPNEKQFFGTNNKSQLSAFRNFLLYQNIICFGWVVNLFLSWAMFFVKKMSFLTKITVLGKYNLFFDCHLEFPHVFSWISWIFHVLNLPLSLVWIFSGEAHCFWYGIGYSPWASDPTVLLLSSKSELQITNSNQNPKKYAKNPRKNKNIKLKK